jgi:hypothetical protein
MVTGGLMRVPITQQQFLDVFGAYNSDTHFWCWRRRATMFHGRHSSPSLVERHSLRRRCCSPLFAQLR